MLPADAAQSELCPTICLACSDAEETDDESSVAGQEEEVTQHGNVASVLAAKAGSEPSDTQRSAPEVHPRFQTLEC